MEKQHQWEQEQKQHEFCMMQIWMMMFQNWQAVLCPSAYLRCTHYLLVLFCQFYDRLPFMCITGLSIHATGLISDLAVILILSSYSPYASYLPYLPL